MALTNKERRLIQELIDRQMQMEQFIASRISPLAGLGVNISHRDPLNSPFILDRDERISTLTRAASGSKRIGRAKRRKVSAYQREFGRQLKKLKAKHPRTNISVLMKKAHRATKRVRK